MVEYILLLPGGGGVLLLGVGSEHPTYVWFETESPESDWGS